MKKSPKTIIIDQDPWMTQVIAFGTLLLNLVVGLLQFFEIDIFHGVLIFINCTSLTTLTILKKNGL